MSDNFISLPVSKIGERVKYANVYELAWMYLNNTLRKLGINSDSSVAKYIAQIHGRGSQQEIQGHRPYSKQAFVYAFPDSTGLSWCAAGLVRHWFQLSLALWEPWLRARLEREGIVITTHFDAIADLVASGSFVQLRGATWCVKADDTSLYRQDTHGIKELLRSDLTSEEASEVALVEQGQCKCPVCASLYLSGDSINRFRSFLSISEPGFFDRQNLFWWIASLRRLDEQLLAETLAVWPQFAVGDWAYAGEVNVHDAFYWLCRRTPGTYDMLKTVAITSVPEQRAAVVAGLRGEYAEGRVSNQVVYDMAGSAITGSYGETIAVLQLLRDCPPADQFAYWDAQIQQALHQHGEERYLGHRLRHAAVNLWILMYAEQAPPEHVKAKVAEHHVLVKEHWPKGAEALKRWGVLS
ncbi:MAG: hypothetical protein AAGF95_14630 [Chloroflexota bacterium]